MPFQRQLSRRQIWGAVVAGRLWLMPVSRELLNHVMDDMVRRSESAPANRLFVMTVGFSQSGKSTLVATHPVLSRLFELSSDEIHRMINPLFPELQDDHTVSGPGFWP